MSARRFKGYAFRGGYLGNAWLCDDETGRCWWSDQVTDSRVVVPDAEGVKAYLGRGPGFGVRKVVKIFAVRKSKPAPLACWSCGETSDIFDGDEHHDGSIETCYCGAPNAITYFVDGTWALTRPSGVNEDGSPEEVGAELEPAPVVAAEGPKPAAWRIEYGPSDYGHTDSAERVARAKSQDAKVTPLYEAPPDGERGAAIRSAIEATLESAKERLLKTLAKGPLTETSIKACLFVARVNGVAESRPNLRNRERKLVRVLDDGAHEAALAAAREEGRREGASQALAECRVRLEYWLDLWRHRAKAPEYPGDEVASGAKVEAYEQAVLTIDAAAKGAAK